jgi:hypothetical protein
VRWTYGRLGRVFISPACHRIHHSATGRLDINLGTVFAIWDVLFLVALALLTTRHLLVVLGAAALMAGTIVGFVLARTVGIFGFHLTFSSGLAWTVLIVEGAGVVLLLLTAALLWQRRQRRAGPGCPLEDNPSSGRGTA